MFSGSESSNYFGSLFDTSVSSSINVNKKSPRKFPVPKLDLPEDNPGYWADHVKKVDNITKRWYKRHDYLFSGKELGPAASTGSEPGQNAIPGLGAGEKGRCIRAVGPWCGEVKTPKMVGGYPSRGINGKCDLVKAPVIMHSPAFDHKRMQFKNPKVSVGCVKTPTSANDFYLRIRSNVRDNSVHTKSPCDINKSKPCSSAYDTEDLFPLTPYGHADRDKMAQRLDGCSWAEVQRRIRGIPDPEMCPKCHRVACTCVPRRRQPVPEFPDDGPSDELPPWPPQIWCGPTYSGTRRGTLGDILRLRYCLSRDPDNRTPMNRMYDETKAVAYYGKNAEHVGENSFSCGGCRTAREAERGTWFDEQLRKATHLQQETLSSRPVLIIAGEIKILLCSGKITLSNNKFFFHLV